MTSSFPTGRMGSTGCRPPPTFASGFILSWAETPLQSVPGPACSARRSAGATFLGVAPSLIATSAGSNARWLPIPSALRPRRFSRPRRFASHPALWVCFTPQPRPGLRLQGFCLSQSRYGSSPPRALSSLARLRCLQLPGSATSPRPALRAFSLREPVARTPVFSRRPSPIPSWCFSSSRCSLAAP